MCEVASIIYQVLMGGALGCLSFVDFRERRVPLWCLLVLLLSSFFMAGIELVKARDYGFLAGDVISGLLVGILFCVTSVITREKIGYGDSLMILILGIGLGGWGITMILEIAAVGLLLFLAVKRERIVPFYPFLFLGYIGFLILELRW